MKLSDLKDRAKVMAYDQKITANAAKSLEARSRVLASKFRPALSKLVSLYPSSQMGTDKNQYSAVLAEVNGRIEDMKSLDQDVATEISRLNSALAKTNASIHDLDRTRANLETATSYADLSATSKRMLSDYVVEYKCIYYGVWAKVIAGLALVYVLVFPQKWTWLALFVGFMVAYYVGEKLYQYFTSRVGGTGFSTTYCADGSVNTGNCPPGTPLPCEVDVSACMVEFTQCFARDGSNCAVDLSQCIIETSQQCPGMEPTWATNWALGQPD